MRHNHRNAPRWHTTTASHEATLRLYGWHTCLAALYNPKRRKQKLYLTKATYEALLKEGVTLPLAPLLLTRQEMDHLFPRGEPPIHQGIVLDVLPLASITLESILEHSKDPCCLVLLDQVTDPQNLGSMMRCAAVFGMQHFVLTKDHAPHMTGALAKVASGSAEYINLCYVTNLASTISFLQERGFMIFGLDERGDSSLGKASFPARTAMVFGAEGKGLRRLTKERCDVLLSLGNLNPSFSTLNVSQAFSCAAFAWHSQQIEL